MTAEARANFKQIVGTRSLEFCPKCEPDRTTHDGMVGVLSVRPGRGFKCACGTSWVWKPNHGVLTTWLP